LVLTTEIAEKLKSLPNIISVENLNSQRQHTIQGFSLMIQHTDGILTITVLSPYLLPGKPLQSIKAIFPFITELCVFENNDLKIDGDKIFINGKEATSYTFKMNYFWMMVTIATTQLIHVTGICSRRSYCRESSICMAFARSEQRMVQR